MDYDPEIVLVALVAHRRFGGSTEGSLGAFTRSLFDRFDPHILDEEKKLNPPLNSPLTSKERSVIAAIASLFGGLPQDAARDAMANYRRLFAR